MELFGQTPWEIQQGMNQQINQAADSYAKLDPSQRAAAGMHRAGGMLAGPVAGMLGMENPAVTQAKRTEQIMGAPGSDLSSSKGLLAKAEQFRQAGDIRTATALFMKGQELARQEQAAALASRKADIDERKANDMDEYRKLQLAQMLEIAKQRSEDTRLGIQARTDAAREANQIKLMIAQLTAQTKQSAADAKGTKLSTYDAKSLERSDKAAESANPALALLKQAKELYSRYESSRTEPIMGPAARVGSVFGIGKERAADYETAQQIAKDLGVIKLGLIGGSDTERELQVAIDTAPSPDKTVEANQKIIANQVKAIEILQAEPDFKREWIEKNGSLAKKDAESGKSYGAAWREFQRAKFKGDSEPPTTPSALSAEDAQALAWANANPNDPRAARIKKKLGVQ